MPSPRSLSFCLLFVYLFSLFNFFPKQVQVLAAAFKRTAVRPIRITTENTGYVQPYMQTAEYYRPAMMAARASVDMPLEAGSAEITANVYVDYLFE